MQPLKKGNLGAAFSDKKGSSIVKGQKKLFSKKDGKNIAVYREENGAFQIFSAICPHLKCVVNWNVDEKTFDCPCHGSRFSCYGKVINGPANKDLERMQVPVPH